MSPTSLIPRYAFLVRGSGTHIDQLQAFDRALSAAGPLAHNLVAVSSILPANCEIITPEEGFKMLTPGQITFCVMARQDSSVPEESIGAAIGVLAPKENNKFGYISEFHGLVVSEENASKKAQELAREMYEAKVGVGGEVDVLSIAAVAKAPEGQWASAVAICVFIV